MAAFALCTSLAVPAVAPAKTPSTTKNKERAQNKKISTAATQAKNAASAIPVIAAQLGTVNTSLVQVVTDLGSPKAVANNVNFLITAVGALANDVASLKTAGTDAKNSITFLSKQTIVAAQLGVNGTLQPDCFVESPPLPTSRNSQTVSGTCVVTQTGANQPLTLPASCRSSKTNGGVCARARVLSLVVDDDNPTSVFKGTEFTLGRNPLINSSDPGTFARGLTSSDNVANAQNLFQGISPTASVASAGNPAIIQFTIQAYDLNPDETTNAPNLS